MEIFRVKKLDMMGFEIEEHLFLSLPEAVSKYKKLLRGFKKDDLAKKDNVQLLSKPIVRERCLVSGNKIAEHMAELWYKCSYEYDEWDTTVNHLILEKLQVN